MEKVHCKKIISTMNQVSNKSQPSSNPPTEGKTKVKTYNGLRKCFSALADRKQVNLELEVLRLMLRTELNIHLDSLDPTLASTLPYLLAHYIKNWPGWQKSVEYYSGNITFKMWYDKFLKFITLKLSEAINVHFKEAMDEINKDELAETKKKYAQKKLIDRSTQTDNLAPKEMYKYSIEIKTKPVLLNTIVFTDTAEGDVIMKQHGVLEWDESISDHITLKQLITWPHVGVHFNSPVFSFTRKNLHEYRRHISLVGVPISSSSVEFIEKAKVLDKTVSRSAYTLKYLKEVTDDLLRVLKVVYTTPDIWKSFKTVIDEFLADIAEIDIQRKGQPTIASSTSMLFNIGKSTYFRNKKLSKGPSSNYDIGYTEIVIPKMETALCSIAPDSKIDEYINFLAKFNSEPNTTQFTLPYITFSCSFCKESFENASLITNHLKEEHKLEQTMLCTQCKKSFPAFVLSNVRWKHRCTSPSKGK